jgi:hypothetical protein
MVGSQGGGDGQNRDRRERRRSAAGACRQTTAGVGCPAYDARCTATDRQSKVLRHHGDADPLEQTGQRRSDLTGVHQPHRRSNLGQVRLDHRGIPGHEIGHHAGQPRPMRLIGQSTNGILDRKSRRRCKRPDRPQSPAWPRRRRWSMQPRHPALRWRPPGPLALRPEDPPPLRGTRLGRLDGHLSLPATGAANASGKSRKGTALTRAEKLRAGTAWWRNAAFSSSVTLPGALGAERP